MTCDDFLGDFLVIGAGVSGASAAYELARHGRVFLLEGEAGPGYHSTGRSAALYTRNFGNRVVRALNAASLPFLLDPPPGFAEHPLLTSRGSLTIATADNRAAIDQLLALGGDGNEIRELTPDQAVEMVPILRRERIAFAAYEPDVMDMDVNAIHQGFLKGLAARGGTLVCGAAVTAIERRGGAWQVATASGGTFAAPILINAAGAWADVVGRLAGLAPVGLVPKRRTAVVVDLPPGVSPRAWPAVDEAGEDSYFKPEADALMASPGDATPVPPGDVQPEELDVAIVADWLERATHLEVRRIAHKWAGLRSFVADDAPVVGRDPTAESFYWLAGQGGYGIMMAEALGRAIAALVATNTLPADITAGGVTVTDLAPDRLRH
jgi:D-arginine dehydrogenase